MERLITADLIAWKESMNRKPLLVRGARQVGKTYSITEFGKKHFEYFIKLDFERDNRLNTIFASSLDPKEIIKSIEIEFEINIKSKKTLLFFDEIQKCPRALMALRYFHEDAPEYHIIAAGSLLEFEMEKISFPVGRVEFKFMFPMTFEEFLQNSGKTNLLKQRPDLSYDQEISESTHQKFLESLKEYFLIGGMPEAVFEYVNTRNFLNVTKVHESLFNSFLQDILKYEKNYTIESLSEVFEMIPRIIGQPVKYCNVSQDLSIYRIKQILHVFEKALLIHKIKSSGAHALPLGGNINKNVIKLCFIDIGLMQHIRGVQANEIIQSKDLLATYKGSLCEQFIAQELLARGGSQNGRLFYWSRAKKNSNAEVDFLMLANGKIVPIEVKNGPAGKLKSLHLFLEEHENSQVGYVLNSGNIGNNGKVRFRPIYSKLNCLS